MAVEGLIETGIAVVLILIAPGYLALLVSLSVRGQRVPKDPLSAAVFSVILSAVISGLYYSSGTLLRGYSSWEAAIHDAISYPLGAIMGVLALVAVVGFGVPLLMRFAFHPLVRRTTELLTRSQTVVLREEDLWDVFMELYELRPIAIETMDGKEFRGFLASYSSGEEEYTIHLSPVDEITYDHHGVPTTTRIGESMLLLEHDIKRIIAVENPADAIGTVQPKRQQEGSLETQRVPAHPNAGAEST